MKVTLYVMSNSYTVRWMDAGSNWNISFQEVDPEGNLFRDGNSLASSLKVKDEPSSYTEVTIEPKI